MWWSLLPIIVIALVLFLVVVLWVPSDRKEGYDDDANLALTAQPCALTATSSVSVESMGKPRPFNTVLLSAAPPQVQQSVLSNANPKPQEAVVSLPSSFDSRDKWKGYISGPLDQAQCGSCWAFATATAISDRIRVATHDAELQQRVCVTLSNGSQINRHNNIAPWVFASCDFCNYSKATNPMLGAFLRGSEGTCSSKVCQGGMIGEAYQYMRDVGGVAMVCNGNIEEYSCDVKPGCKKFRPDTVYPVIDQNSSDTAEVQMMKDIYLYGPLTIGYTVYSGFESFFQSPSNAKEVFSSTSYIGQPVGGHAVDIVGWGTSTGGVKFWLVRNSWGPYWADSGYFRIQRGINFCGVESPSEVWGAGVKKTVGLSTMDVSSLQRGIVVNPTSVQKSAADMQSTRYAQEVMAAVSQNSTNWLAPPGSATHEVVSVLGSSEGAMNAFDQQQSLYGASEAQQHAAIQATWGNGLQQAPAPTDNTYAVMSVFGSSEGAIQAFNAQQAMFGATEAQQHQAIQNTWGCQQ